MTRLFSIVLLVLLVSACGGPKVKADPQPTGDAADLDEPTAEELAEAPCGNANWSELPPGSEAPAE